VEHQVQSYSFRLLFVLFFLGSIIGCGAEVGTHVPTVKPSPVGGAMVRLPHNEGLVAIKTEPADSSRATKTKLQATKIVAVFFENDGSTPMNPPPTGVSFELEALRSKTPQFRTVILESDPTTPNRFISAPGSFPGGLEGKIRVKIDGRDVEESFSAR
jgi:hypothetical protein